MDWKEPNMRKVALLDLHKQYVAHQAEIREAIDRVLDSQRFILGPEVTNLEATCAKYTDSKFGVGLSSGSDALIIALMVLGIKEGDEVITTPYTFFATVGAIHRVGAKAVLVDIDPTDYNIDPTKIEKAITKNTKAIIPVHLYGQSADMKTIMDIANKHGLYVIEDAAQAIGTEYQGKRVGSIGHIGCFSFFPSKNLGAYGDGGLCTTNDPALAEKLQIFRAHGSKPKYFHKFVGGNFRLDAMQAAILNVKIKYLDNWTNGRQENAKTYDKLFQEAGLSSKVKTPWVRPGDRHIYNQYVISVENRDGLKKFLAENGVETEIYYPLSMHMQECFQYLGYKVGDFPVSEQSSANTLAVPVYPEVQKEDLEYVVSTIKKFYNT